jgi:hypothetical protein
MSVSTPVAPSYAAVETANTLPVGYTEAMYWRLATDWRRLVAANLMGLVSAPLATVFFGALAVAVTGFNPSRFLGVGGYEAQGEPASIVALIVAIIGSMVIHELTHGAAIRWCGNRPSYGFQWAGLVPYATAEGQYFTRNQFIICALAPLVCLSLLGSMLLPVAPLWLVPWLVLGLIANAAGAVGDVWMSIIALRYPSSTWIVDERDGMRVYIVEK